MLSKPKNKTKQNKTVEQINETRSWFFETMNKMINTSQFDQQEKGKDPNK